MIIAGLIILLFILVVLFVKNNPKPRSAKTESFDTKHENIDPVLDCMKKIPADNEVSHFIFRYLNKLNLKFHNTDSGNSFWIAFTHSETEERHLLVRRSPGGNHIEVGCLILENVSDESLPRLAELINRINYERTIGKFVLIYETRQVIFNSHIPLFENMVTLTQLDIHFKESYRVLDRYSDAFKAVSINNEEPLMAYLNITSADEQE